MFYIINSSPMLVISPLNYLTIPVNFDLPIMGFPSIWRLNILHNNNNNKCLETLPKENYFTALTKTENAQ